MKASSRFFLFALPVLLLLGGCLEPMPFDRPGYPRNQSSLRYPPGTTGGPRVNAPGNNGYRRSPWDRPPASYPNNTNPYGQPPRDNLLPKPEPEPEPKPRLPEDSPLVEIDPLEVPEKPKFEYAIPVQGASGLVVSPYAKEGPYIDVNGLSSGTQIECPKTKKTILVP